MYSSRLNNLRNTMASQKLNAILVSNKSNIRYLSGFSGSEGDLFVTATSAYLLCDARYTIQASLECPNCKVIDTVDGIYNIINGIIKNEKIKTLGIEDRALSLAAYNIISKEITGVKLATVGNLVSTPRIIKDERELASLKKAAYIADRAFAHVLPLIKEGISEIEIAAELEYSMRKDGADAIAFDTIVASGANGAKPHGTASEKLIEKGDFVVMDFGCVYNGYCSDITRTVAVGPITEEQKNVYNCVLFVQKKMLSLIREGMPCSQADAFARNHLKLFGLDRYFTHSLGHGVGLDIHEQPNISRRSQHTVQNNMVFSVEPGVYFEGKYGIRIEDTVVISGGKPYIFNTAPKELIII